MKFIDIASIYVKAGDGGDGHISFRKEKYVPKGGPDGGNGGKGGDVIVKVDPHMNTLLDFKYNREFIAENGANGGKSRKTGKDGKNVYVKVPQGTEIKDIDGNIIADLAETGDEIALLRGGNGGWGNSMFATPTNQAPRHANPGQEGAGMEVILELKLLADVGLVGFPNAGKSTLISVLSSSRPKIADYPFTTLVPNLGIASVGVGQNFTIADIPGLIEGASEGKGLGLQFLRHIERCRLLVFLISAESHTPEKDYLVLRKELDKYNPDMSFKKRIICISKIDILSPEDLHHLNKMEFKDKNVPVLYVSSIAQSNISELKLLIWKFLTQN